MHTSTIIIDNFYKDPDLEREYALSLDFNREGNYPGMRTKNIELSDSVFGTIANAIRHSSGEILRSTGSSGSFQYTTCHDKSWIHSDGEGWAGVCYLTPHAPVSSGTGLYRHKETGISTTPLWDRASFPNSEYENKKEISDHLDNDGNDLTKWELVTSIGNVYNRLVLYRQELYHMSQDYFGQCAESGRLFQVFFFDTQDGKYNPNK
tara:strand:- start:16 stop:636 length:621 start_codon:yes stop_codon:yes gene_type:complete